MRHSMKSFDVDLDKMPLGVLSPAQVARGTAVMVELRGVLGAGAPSDSPE